jgi:hypothetical protein
MSCPCSEILWVHVIYPAAEGLFTCFGGASIHYVLLNEKGIEKLGYLYTHIYVHGYTSEWLLSIGLLPGLLWPTGLKLNRSRRRRLEPFVNLIGVIVN